MGLVSGAFGLLVGGALVTAILITVTEGLFYHWPVYAAAIVVTVLFCSKKG